MAYIIQDARFSPNHVESVTTSTPTIVPIRIPSTLSTLAPNSTQVANSSTVVVDIDEKNTLGILDGKIFITVNSITRPYDNINATIGAPGCVNQEIKDVPIGYAVIYECDNKYDIRFGSVKRRDGFITVTFSVEFYVTELEK